jgi:hypothetical protein
LLSIASIAAPAWAATAPSTYSAYSGTDPKPSPSPPPALGPANSIFRDPTFGSRILRVTDGNTAGGMSIIPEDAGYFRTWNADATALKLKNTNGKSWWVSFDPVSFTVGGGSSPPTLHPLNIDYSWDWSAVNPDLIYFLNGNQLAQYSKSTGAISNLGGPPNGHPVTYHVSVVGQDNWVCSAAGPGGQDTYTELFCVAPGTMQTKFIDVVNRTINGVPQTDPNWPTSAPGQTIGIHSIFGSAGGAWLGVVFVQQSWGANGIAVVESFHQPVVLGDGGRPFLRPHVPGERQVRKRVRLDERSRFTGRHAARPEQFDGRVSIRVLYAATDHRRVVRRRA